VSSPNMRRFSGEIPTQRDRRGGVYLSLPVTKFKDATHDLEHTEIINMCPMDTAWHVGCL
jgi:hypothetical protein